MTPPAPARTKAARTPSRRGPAALSRAGLSALLALAGCAPVAAGRSLAPTAGPTAAAPTIPPDAARSADPVAARLVLYLRLLTPDGGSAAEIAAFLHDNPTWPNHALLTQRLDQAIGAETNSAVLGTLCGSATLLSSQSLRRCVGPSLPSAPMLPPTPAIAQAVRAAWIQGLDQPSQESAFLADWSGLLTTQDHWQRFDRLEWAGNLNAAARMLPLLAPADRPLATARLSLHRNATGADGIASALQGDAAQDPALLLDLVRWLRRADRDDEALSIWRTRAVAAESRVQPTHLAAFWSERDALARDLLRDHHDADALFVADDDRQTDPAAHLDSAFLTGWISLRRLHDPAGAETRFTRLLSAEAAITRSRGEYWVGRARLARGDTAGGRESLVRAAAFPTTFYGQLATARLQDPPPGPATLLDPSLAAGTIAASLADLHDPRWSGADAIRFAGLELARAAELLVAWNDPRHARAFLLKLDQTVTSDTDHALAASLADRLGLPDVAVAIARAAGRHGLVLPEAGWPRPYAPPADSALPPGLALAIMRQESSFDPGIVSPAGASGLMQLTAGTAHDTARALGRPELAAGSLFDPDVNLALGTGYLSALLTRFGGVLPYTIAAYNAGPRRVDRWLAANGDPARTPAAAGPDDDAQARMIDWIEMIPFAETRNYVQRVMENRLVYQSRPGSRA